MKRFMKISAAALMVGGAMMFAAPQEANAGGRVVYSYPTPYYVARPVVAPVVVAPRVIVRRPVIYRPWIAPRLYAPRVIAPVPVVRPFYGGFYY